MLQVYISNGLDVSEVCCNCFDVDVPKEDRDVAYAAIAVHVCCKLLFHMFHLFVQTYVASVFIWMLHTFHTYAAIVLFGCCICFTHMLLVFYLDVAYVLQCFFKCFSSAFASVSEASFICLQTYVVNSTS
jgi:hypothetical protein